MWGIVRWILASITLAIESRAASYVEYRFTLLGIYIILWIARSSKGLPYADRQSIE